jgi:membrane protein
MNFQGIKDLFVRSFRQFGEDKVPRLAASLTFFALLALSPILVLAVAAAGLFLGDESVRQEIEGQVASAVGPQVGEFVSTLLENAREPGTGIVASLLSLGVALFAASNLFSQLSDAADTIWGRKQDQTGIMGFLVQRFFAVLMVFAFLLLVLAWTILDSWLAYLGRQAEGFPGWTLLSLGVSILFLTGVFAASFKALPKGMVQWQDVWIGAAVTAVAFAVTKFLLGFYFSMAGIATAYGPAGAVVLLLLWIFYMSQISFFGMELPYSYAHTRGSRAGRREQREEMQLQVS